MKSLDRRAGDGDGASFSAGWILAVSAAITLVMLLATGTLNLGDDRVCDCGAPAGAPPAGAPPAGASPAGASPAFGPVDAARNVSTRMLVETLDLGLHDLALAVSRRAQAPGGAEPQLMQDIATLKNMIALQDVKAQYRAVRDMLETCVRERGAGAASP